MTLYSTISSLIKTDATLTSENVILVLRSWTEQITDRSKQRQQEQKQKEQRAFEQSALREEARRKRVMRERNSAVC